MDAESGADFTGLDQPGFGERDRTKAAQNGAVQPVAMAWFQIDKDCPVTI